MKIEDSEAEILRTPIKIEKLSWWNRSGVEFIMNFEFHGFLEKNTFQKKKKAKRLMIFYISSFQYHTVLLNV